MHKHRTLPVDTRRALVERSKGSVTLDGWPAVVTGYMNDYATVRTIDGPLYVEFAWETVERVMSARNGEFKS